VVLIELENGLHLWAIVVLDNITITVNQLEVIFMKCVFIGLSATSTYMFVILVCSSGTRALRVVSTVVVIHSIVHQGERGQTELPALHRVGVNSGLFFMNHHNIGVSHALQDYGTCVVIIIIIILFHLSCISCVE